MEKEFNTPPKKEQNYDENYTSPSYTEGVWKGLNSKKDINDSQLLKHKNGNFN